jgi:hypothetical protein
MPIGHLFFHLFRANRYLGLRIAIFFNMTLLLASLSLFWIFGLAVIAIALRNAPEAYEDETGFHYLETIWRNNSPEARDIACVWTDGLAGAAA